MRICELPASPKLGNDASNELSLASDESEALQERQTASEVVGLQKKAVPPVSFYLKQRRILINLILISVLWLSSAFGYYLIFSLINTFEEVYVTGLTSSASEIFAIAISGVLY